MRIVRQNSYRKGDRVRLAAFEDQPEEDGKVMEDEAPSYPGMYIVVVDEPADDGQDDGIREISIDQILGKLVEDDNA